MSSFSTLVETLMARLGESFPNIVGAVAILLAGWAVALIVRLGVRRALARIRLNQRVQRITESALDLEKGSATVVYYLVVILAVIAFFNTLNLGQVSAPLRSMVEQVLTFFPNAVAAAVLVLIAWVTATLFRALVRKALSLTRFEERISTDTKSRISEIAGNVVYGLTLLLFLPGILGVLGLDGLLEPVAGVVDSILAMFPNMLAAAALGVVGWLVARILRDVVTNLVAATGADKGAERLGLKGTLSLSKLSGLLAFVFVFVPALIAALDALKIETVSAPATEILATLMAAIPYLFSAALILIIAVFIADLASNLGAGLLGGIGFDRLPEKLGLQHAVPKNTTLSKMAGTVLKFVILALSAIEAAKVLGFTQVSEYINTFVALGGQVLLGAAIIAVGLWLATLAHGAISRLGGSNSALWAGLARFAILGLVFAMGLRAMGIAEDIVTLAFALTLGAVAVAAALSFGLGGREAAGRQMEAWFTRMRGERPTRGSESTR